MTSSMFRYGCDDLLFNENENTCSASKRFELAHFVNYGSTLLPSVISSCDSDFRPPPPLLLPLFWMEVRFDCVVWRSGILGLVGLCHFGEFWRASELSSWSSVSATVKEMRGEKNRR
ncbi:hypothetical protein F0562_019365 [Nyssa sinensis]|uniref:Uncharacterized protein n=1 Tax=Nyssa sinensis TaxID=561372 RepID=A0A5J4ZEL3_9ASTE|nr:hypothetical protein F0562_019365 [Nyssa sinensis]